jgi:hypothetical protein
MAPNGDMPDRDSQRESFSLANMVPQDGENNRHIWAPIEGAVRKMAKKEGELYVITGPAFLGGNLRKVGNVLVPTHLYKLVYSPRQKAGAAWFVENTADADIHVIPVAELERIVGIEFLPSLTRQQKERMLRLPKIRQRSQASSPFPDPQETGAFHDREKAFVPYANEADVLEIDNLMLENRLDRITISGDVDLTADKQGLARRGACTSCWGGRRQPGRAGLAGQLPPPAGRQTGVDTPPSGSARPLSGRRRAYPPRTRCAAATQLTGRKARFSFFRSLFAQHL